jgi:hypothetical protein
VGWKEMELVLKCDLPPRPEDKDSRAVEIMVFKKKCFFVIK